MPPTTGTSHARLRLVFPRTRCLRLVPIVQKLHWQASGFDAASALWFRGLRVPLSAARTRGIEGRAQCLLPIEAMKSAITDVIAPEVIREIRLEIEVLLETAENIQAGLETGRFDEVARNAAELGQVVRRHVLLVNGILDVLSPDDISAPGEAR